MVNLRDVTTGIRARFSTIGLTGSLASKGKNILILTFVFIYVQKYKTRLA